MLLLGCFICSRCNWNVWCIQDVSKFRFIISYVCPRYTKISSPVPVSLWQWEGSGLRRYLPCVDLVNQLVIKGFIQSLLKYKFIHNHPCVMFLIVWFVEQLVNGYVKSGYMRSMWYSLYCLVSPFRGLDNQCPIWLLRRGIRQLNYLLINIWFVCPTM